MALKKGTTYELVVAEVLRAFDPGATINRGEWIEGPDGQRELDVHIVGEHEGQARRVLVECKDFNPESTGPVGIGYVDALESKRRDLGFDFSAICSNAGFTEGAVRKAGRVGIGLIGVMKRGDKRIRFSVSEELYTRKIKVEELRMSLKGPEPISSEGIPIEEILFNGIPVENWVVHRAMLLMACNPIVNGSYTASHEFHTKLEFMIPSGPVQVSQLDFHIWISGGWYAQQVSLDATRGIFDWIRHRVRLAPGPAEFMINGVDIYAGELIDRPPHREMDQMKDIDPGDLLTRLTLITGLLPLEPVPNLTAYVKLDDLDLMIPELPEEAYTSVGA